MLEILPFNKKNENRDLCNFVFKCISFLDTGVRSCINSFLALFLKK